jgi:uncharacterized iron-regulated membrane protein
VKLSAHAWRAQWDLHGWVGAAISLPLFVLFFCGIFALYRHDIEIWQEPALHASPSSPLDWDALLSEIAAPAGSSVGVVRHPPGRAVHVTVWSEGESRSWLLDPATGERQPPRSRLGDALYRLHYLEPIPLGPELAGLVSLVFLAATVSGLVLHLKDLPGQTWQFRPHLKRRFVASDAHKVLGLFGLPFALVFGWSGAMLGWFDTQTALFAELGFGGDRARVEELRGYASIERVPTGQPAPSLPPSALIEAAGQATGLRRDPEYFDLMSVGDERAHASVFWETGGLVPRAWARVDAPSGAVFASASASSTPANELDKVLFDLHYARFGGRLVQAGYAVLALGVAGVLLTGNLVWLERRDPRRQRRGNRLLERATAGVPGGLVLGCAVAFALNRALPTGLEGSAELELMGLYVAWLAAAAAAWLPGIGPRAALGWTLGLAGALFLAAAALGLRLDAAIEPVRAVDALLLALGLGCAGSSLVLLRPRPA